MKVCYKVRNVILLGKRSLFCYIVLFICLEIYAYNNASTKPIAVIVGNNNYLVFIPQEKRSEALRLNRAASVRLAETEYLLNAGSDNGKQIDFGSASSQRELI